jgi:hypothetical protein
MTSTPPSHQPTAKKGLLGTTDAEIWAAEFVRIFNGASIGAGLVDEGTMLTWFANAIETGRDAGRKETCPHEDTFAVADNLWCCRACGFLIQPTPLIEVLSEDEDDEEEGPTLEEKFLEGFQEGR